jgi:hypothetical protein
MGRLKVLLALLCCLALSSAPAQDSGFIPARDSVLHLFSIKEIEGEYTGFTVDPLGNIYLVNSANQIRKLNSDFKELAVFDEGKQYGTIYSVDVSNPLKVMVFYRDFTTVMVLDGLLGFRNITDLRNRNISEVKAIARSYDNNYWLFDEWDDKIKKVDENGKVLMESPDFRILFQDVPDPSYIADRNGLLYLYDSRTGWLVFDYYGVMKRSFDFTGWKDPQVSGKKLTGRDDRYFYAAVTEQLQLTKTRPDVFLQNVLKVVIQSGQVYILHNNCLDIYKAY